MMHPQRATAPRRDDDLLISVLISAVAALIMTMGVVADRPIELCIGIVLAFLAGMVIARPRRGPP